MSSPHLPEMDLSLSFNVRAQSANPALADDALKRFERLVQGLNGSNVLPERAPSAPLAFRLSSPLADATVFKALIVLQESMWQLGRGLSEHHGEAVSFEGTISTGAQMRGGFLPMTVDVRNIPEQSYTIEGSVVRKHDGSVAFPAVVERERALLDHTAVEVATESNALESVGEAPVVARVRPKR